MKILLCTRDNYLLNFAGDSVQVLSTFSFLKKIGIHVVINDGEILDYSKYDIVHIFNLTRIREAYESYTLAKKHGCITVISPIYWNLTKYYIHTGNIEYLESWKKSEGYRSEIIKGCKMIYPASYLEMEMLKNDFGEDLPYKVVYNGVKLAYINKIQINRNRNRTDFYILCAARICPRKNQLLLSDICYKLGMKLALAGPINNREYLNKCLEYKNVKYIGFLDEFKLANVYAHAKMHVLPSFVETPGLSSLEAAVCGCNVVSTIEGSAQEYFQDMAVYCDPYDKHDIANAVIKGLEFNKQPQLKQYIASRFSWDCCLEDLYSSYLSLTGN